MEIEQVKKDLRNIRRLSHTAKVLKDTEKQHRERIELLRSRTGTEETIKKIERFIASLGVDRYITQVTELENRYMAAIERLDRIERTIILDGFICGKPYWKIGSEIGYSVEAVQKKVNCIMAKIAQMM